LAIFSAVFLLAAAAVVWVAVREVDRERLVRENERIVALKQTADSFADRIAASLKSEFASLTKSAADLSPSATGDELSALISRSVTIPGAFREIFLIEKGRDPISLASRAPFSLASGSDAPTASPSGVQSESFRAAERLEFKAKDFPVAISAYEKILSNARAASSRARILNALARVYRKSGQGEKSIETYARLSREARFELSDDGVPFGVLAAIETGTIQKEAGRPGPALETWFSLYTEILSGRFSLSREQFRAFASLLDDLIGASVRPGTPDALAANASKRGETFKRQVAEINDRLRIGDIIRTHFSVAPVVTASLSPGSPGPVFQTRLIDGGLWTAGFLPLQGGRFLGALFDERTGFEKFVSPAFAAGRGSPAIEIVVVDGSGRTIGGASGIPATAAPAYQQSLPHPFAMWTARLADARPVRFEPEFRRKRNLYLGAAILVLAALFAGGWTTLRGMAKDMEVADLKSDFVATVSHELRTPLTGIRALSELLKNDRVPDDQTRRRYYATLYRESERLGRMIENILDFSKIEAGLKKYRFSPTDPAALTREAAIRFQESTADKGFHLQVRTEDSLLPAELDAEAVDRVLFNVLDNAAKYSGDAREIELSVRGESGHVVWEVRDHGLGIPTADLPRVFEKFFRSAKNLDSSVRGSGIGLTLVKHIVEAHGGTVSIASHEGAGTTVTITIPLENTHDSTGG
jgi:signal transduction histidine kinase/tetratricopeptide (TPR) repeat protein